MLEETTQHEIAQPEIAQPEPPGLSIGDLVQVVKIITVAQQRGAIHINEMSSVGLLYDKLIAFLDANGAIEKNAS